jgi:hypothetical protein
MYARALADVPSSLEKISGCWAQRMLYESSSSALRMLSGMMREKSQYRSDP